ETYAYRRLGGGIRRPLICLQHFTGTLDNWDPAVVDALASDREVILFDGAGVGRSTGKVPNTVAEMASHALDFLDALRLTSCDLHYGLRTSIHQPDPALLRRKWPRFVNGSNPVVRLSPI